MRQQYHFRPSAKGLLAWDVFRLIALSSDLEVVVVPLDQIAEFDEVFWYTSDDSRPTCRSIASHAALIQQADLQYPIILCHKGGLMDGMHRVCKAHMLGHSTIRAVRFDAYVEPDHIGVSPDELPY